MEKKTKALAAIAAGALAFTLVAKLTGTEVEQ